MSEAVEHIRKDTEIMLQDMDGNLQPAAIETGRSDWTDSKGCRHTDCRIKLSWSGGLVEATDWNGFASFKKVRKQLEAYNFLPVCYGASRRVIMTGMGTDMGGGWRIWRVNQADEMYRPVVDIFKTGEEVEPVRVEEQEAFQAEWFKRQEGERSSQQNNPDGAY
jgi:hypothetical protein